MGKRKQTAPRQADEGKRQQLQWNMTDVMSGSASSFVVNTDHSLVEEETDLNNKSPSSSSVDVQTPAHALRVDAFYQNLAFCQSRLTLYSGETTIKDKSQLLNFGAFKVRLIPHPSSTPLPDQLPDFKECWLYVVGDENPHMLYFEVEDNDENVIIKKKSKSRQSKFGIYWFASVNVPVQVLSGLKGKSFMLLCNEYDPLHRELSITIFGCAGVVLKLSHPSECIRIKATQLAVQRLMEYFYDLFYPYNFEGREVIKGHNFFHLYENVTLIQKDNMLGDSLWVNEVANIRHSCLKPLLRPYQKESVAWMLRQERKCQMFQSDKNDIHPLYSEVKLKDGKVFYYNKCAGSLIQDRPEVMTSLQGGILADEMGLGKTVEVLCCMLLNPRQDVQLPEQLPVLDDEEEDDDDGGETEDDNENGDERNKSDQQSEQLSHSGDAVSSANSRNNDEEGEQSHDQRKCSGNAGQNENSDSLPVASTSDPPLVSETEREESTIASSNCIESVAEITVQNHHVSLKNSSVSENEVAKCNNVDNFKCAKSRLETETNDSEIEAVGPLDSGDGIETKSTGASQKVPRRKSKGITEYVPMTEDDNVGIFSSKPVRRKQFFECNCGQLDNEEETIRKGFHKVTCLKCEMSQHAECMNYDLKDPYRGPYLCPHCHAISSKIKSGATLIISPSSICHQWIDEIRKHIKECSIRVFIYTGVSKHGYIQPQTLAHQDIVITTYDVLRKELDFVDLPHTNSESGRRFRHPKRFLATPSPLVAVEWWRICLDEAQMVECVTTKTAEMALRLKSVNRWCVTGTPLMRSVEDIYGLLLFLGMDPFQVQQWFKLLVWDPFCHGIMAPMHHTLAQVLWRTAKKDVVDQIDLPAQIEEVYWLTFSPVEEHFYRRQYEVYQRNTALYKHRNSMRQDPRSKLHTLDRKTLNELLNPLFRLRQACCHPQIVRGAFLPLNKTMMNMDEVLEHMTKKVKTECEEAHRQVVASLNGMAGLAIIKHKLPVAVEKYREVLHSVAEHKNQFRTDDLQQLHAMHNLACVLDQKPEGVAPTLRDDSLREQCEELKVKYVSKALSKVTASEEALKAVSSSGEELFQQMDQLDGDWWADIVDMTVQRGIDDELVDKVKDDLLKTYSDLLKASSSKGSIADVFNGATGLMYVIDTHLQSLAKARKTLSSQLTELAGNKSQSLVQETALCCMRPVGEILNECPFCKVHELFNEYESKLFMFVERGLTVAGDESSMAYQISTKRQGTWADSEVEKVLKAILAFYRINFAADKDVIEAANLQIKYLDVLKKEFKSFRAMWLAHRERISAVDELAMATERLRLREEYEPESANKILNVIELHEMNHHELKCSSDEIVGRSELRKKQGQLIYLTNLAQQSLSGMERNPDLCPICQSELGVEWSVLLCGHCYCLNCMRTLIDRGIIACYLQQEQRMKCPLCRNVTSVKEIAYVTTKKKEETEVKGSHSTKVQAILDCLIKIRQKDPSAKSLVFSMWVSVLDILAAALVENNIPYRTLHDPSQFQKHLSSFKKDQFVQVLLLPLHTGANGLNLVEANHVLLVEPELNLEEEAQAISRIYRIGQTRQTKIHRFLVRGTIEEKIFHMVKSLRASKEIAKDEDIDEDLELTVGDITSLLQQPCPDENEEEEEMVGIETGHDQASSHITEAGSSGENNHILNGDHILSEEVGTSLESRVTRNAIDINNREIDESTTNTIISNSDIESQNPPPIADSVTGGESHMIDIANMEIEGSTINTIVSNSDLEDIESQNPPPTVDTVMRGESHVIRNDIDINNIEIEGSTTNTIVSNNDNEVPESQNPPPVMSDAIDIA